MRIARSVDANTKEVSSMNYVFDTVPPEIKDGNHQQAVRWKEYMHEAADIRKKTSSRLRKERLETLDRDARRYLQMIRRESDVERN